MTVKILYRRNKCIGCSSCVVANKIRWRVSRKDGKCTLVGGKEKNGIYSINVDESEFDVNVTAAKNCPASIIEVRRV